MSCFVSVEVVDGMDASFSIDIILDLALSNKCANNKIGGALGFLHIFYSLVAIS